ncbi:hypothetical protein IWX49DRAFT_357332 [Phyllosticta citricarpa]
MEWGRVQWMAVDNRCPSTSTSHATRNHRVRLITTNQPTEPTKRPSNGNQRNRRAKRPTRLALAHFHLSIPHQHSSSNVQSQSSNQPKQKPKQKPTKKKGKKKKKATTNSAVRRCIDFATPFFLHYLLFSILLLRRSTLQFPISCIGGKRFFFFLLFSFSPFLLFFFFFATASASWRVDLACFVECQNISLRTCVCQMGV